MSPLDYIYSDTINVLMALNKRVLDVTGRLSLMAPQPEVMQILKRAGIHNILRVFETETELIKSSEDMILQTSSLNMSDVEAAKQKSPQSEFDQLRDEIGSAFHSGDDSQQSDQFVQQQGPSQTKTGSDQDFDQMFQQFETDQSGFGRSGFGAPPPVQSPQQPKFQPRQFSQHPTPPMPLRPAAPAHPQQPMNIPKFEPDYSSVRPETQRFTVPPAATPVPEDHSFQPPETGKKAFSLEDEGNFDIPKVKPPKKSRLHDDFDSLDDEPFDEDEFKKKSPLPALIIVLLIVALAGVGGVIAYISLNKEKPAPVASTVKPTIPPPTPQVPVETPPADTVGTKDKVDAETEISKAEPVKPTPPPVRRAVPKKPTAPRVHRSSPPPARRVSTPKKTVTPPTPNEVVISSSPSGATVSINGKRMGTTPYTWNKPFFGKTTIKLAKSGYEDATKTIEFTGGSIKESFTLDRERKPEPPPPPVRTPVRSTAPSVAKKAPPPPPSGDDDDPFANIESDDDFSFDDEPASSAPARKSPSVSSPSASTPRATTPSTGGGGTALIFIASIPPVADVYIGDKLIGKTNVSELKIPSGVQTLKFVKGGKEITKQLNLKPGKNPSQMVRIP